MSETLKNEITIPKPDSNILHWSACFLSCCCYLFFSIISNRNIKKLINHFKYEDSTWVPYSVTNPFLYLLIIHTFMGFISLLIHLLVKILFKISSIPSTSICKKRLRTGRSVIGHGIAHIMDQFDDTMIDGILGRPKHIWGLLLCGILMLLLIISRYLWIFSIENTAPPFAQFINYAFIIFVVTLSFWVLRDSLHIMKVLSLLLCFFGLYIEFYGEINQTGFETYHWISKVRGTIQGITSAILLGSYFVFYRLLNPGGWMTIILSYQGIGAGIIGFIIISFIRFIMPNYYGELSTSPFNHKFNIYILLISSLWQIPIWFFVNQATRWGEPTAIAIAFIVGQTASVFIEAFYMSNYTIISQSHIFALLLTTAGFTIDILYQLLVAIRRWNNAINAEKKNYEDLESEEKLIIGDEYTI